MAETIAINSKCVDSELDAENCEKNAANKHWVLESDGSRVSI